MWFGLVCQNVFGTDCDSHLLDPKHFNSNKQNQHFYWFIWQMHKMFVILAQLFMTSQYRSLWKYMETLKIPEPVLLSGHHCMRK
jgi:hypothetical protein